MSTLYIADLDGTLLRPDGSLGLRTLAVVNNFIASGGLFTYATGRSFHSAKRVLEGLELNLPAITYAGAMIVDPNSGVAEVAEMIPSHAIEDLLNVFADSGLQPILFVIQDGRDRVCWLEGELSSGIAYFLGSRLGDPRHMPLRNWQEINLESVFYISVIASESELLGVRRKLDMNVQNSCHTVLVEDIYTPGYQWLEFTSALGTKAYAANKVRAVAKADSIVCFGDSHNDLSLFAIADHSYAMANALEEVKSQATAVIGSNSDEGVAIWLEDRLLKNPE